MVKYLPKNAKYHEIVRTCYSVEYITAGKWFYRNSQHYHIVYFNESINTILINKSKTCSSWTIGPNIYRFIVIPMYFVSLWTEIYPLTGVHIPECITTEDDDNPGYASDQCLDGLCWCVTRDGAAVEGTLTKGKLDCDENGT